MTVTGLTHQDQPGVYEVSRWSLSILQKEQDGCRLF